MNPIKQNTITQNHTFVSWLLYTFLIHLYPEPNTFYLSLCLSLIHTNYILFSFLISRSIEYTPSLLIDSNNVCLKIENETLTVIKCIFETEKNVFSKFSPAFGTLTHHHSPNEKATTTYLTHYFFPFQKQLINFKSNFKQKNNFLQIAVYKKEQP